MVSRWVQWKNDCQISKTGQRLGQNQSANNQKGQNFNINGISGGLIFDASYREVIRVSYEFLDVPTSTIGTSHQGGSLSPTRLD